MPALHTITVTDEPAAWEAAGFRIVDGRVSLGGVNIAFDAGAPQSISWTFDQLGGLSETDQSNDAAVELDGIATFVGPAPAGAEPDNPNGVFHLDHAVMLSPSLPRTVPRLETAGFEVRRRRDIGHGREQVFLWAGPTIIELVGPVEAPDEGLDAPSQLWGLAMSTTDLHDAASKLGDNLGAIKDAVQQGRDIATVRTGELGISPTIALMTPHIA